MANATATATKRPRKTAAERAQADYDSATKRHVTAATKLRKAEEGIADLRAEVKQAEAEVNFRSQNPALPAQTATEAPTTNED